MAVLIPLLLMGGIIGRLFREFAVTVAMAIFVSLVVSLTLTPMMCSRFLQARTAKPGTAGSIDGASAASTGCCTPMSAASTACCGTSSPRSASSSRRVALSVYLFVIIPKGFFPQQDNGFITGISEAAQDISFADMKRHQQELSDIVQAIRRRERRDVHRRRRHRAQYRPHVSSL